MEILKINKLKNVFLGVFSPNSIILKLFIKYFESANLEN